ncbi:MAG: Eco57I restriction-modification methylase domain-containing protein [Gemmatimonadaceae bacterium]
MDEVLVQLGFPGPVRALDPVARERLGMPPGVTCARVARGDGTLRALVVEIAGNAEARHTLEIVARQLSARVPHLLWLVIALQTERPLFTVMVWRSSAAKPRLLTLSTERGNVIDSDAETLCALVACADGPGGDVMRHMRWMDVLGREAITRRFYHALEASVGRLATSLGSDVPIVAAREMALLTTSRLLFLSFLETKGWLDADFGFLANGFADCMGTGGRYHKRVLDPLFFGTLNTRTAARSTRARAFGQVPFLNGGLFARSRLERRWRPLTFSDDALGAFFGDLLVRYRFTPREGAISWSEAAIDPEILGKAFESLMSADERKKGGVFYTPQEFVERLTTLTLLPALTCARVPQDVAERALSGEQIDPDSRAILLRRTADMRILDPACGSGAFLVHTLERISRLRGTLGDTRPSAEIRRSVLTQSIYGVDINPTAVWLCELRLWLATVIESDERDPMRVMPLPNLDRQIRVGDSLAGPAFGNVPSPASAHSISRLRQRYTRATGQRKVTLSRALDRAERQRAVEQLDRALTRTCAERREVVWSARATDLFDTRIAPGAHTRERLALLRRTVRSLRARRLAVARGAALPFSYAAHFADAADAGGFDVVIGNPPWIRIHNISVAARESYKESFKTFRHAAWSSGASAAGAGTGFGGQSDASSLFLERSCELVKSEGSVGLLLPSKLWRSLAGGGARHLVQDRMHLAALEDYSEAPPSFDAAVYPSLLVAIKRGGARTDLYAGPHAGLYADVPSDTTAAAVPILIAGVQRGVTVIRWPTAPAALSLDESAGSPWILVPPAVRAAFDRISAAGTPMVRAACGRPWLGVKTGCNAAFVVRELSENGDLAHVCSGDRTGTIEQSVLRPMVRGETLTRWTVARGTERIIWTHDDDAAPLQDLPAHALKWLTRWCRILERRSDARQDHQWWSLFRVEAADCARARVVWNDFGRSPRAALLMPGDDMVPLNSCYVARCDAVADACTLTALINSPLAAAWLSVLAEPARGGYHRYLGWTMAMLPLPTEWPRARDILAPLAAAAMNGTVPSEHELHHATLSAYRLRPDTVAPLLQWAGRE